jgi:hypothetical protein
MDNDERIERLQRRRESVLTIVLSGLGGLGILLFLVVITWGWLLYAVLAVLGIGLFALINYFLWGRSMMAQTAGEREEEQVRASMERQWWEQSETEQPRHL